MRTRRNETPRGVGPRCEITEVRREREEMEGTGDGKKVRRGIGGRNSMGDSHEREQEQEQERQVDRTG